MKFNSSENVNAVLSEGLTEKAFGILANEKMFGILSSKIYTDKMMAPIRELSCNAYDANVEAGKGDTPIRVHVPTYEEPFFAVEDDGPGMDDEQITNLYTTYGASSKTSSNEVIGCLGLGSKSPFAYTESFTIESVKNGVKRTYQCFIEAQMPKLVKFDESQTELPSGTKVSFPVKKSDLYYFERDCEAFFRNFSPRPVFSFELNIPEPYQFEDGLCFTWPRGVLMGNVVYTYDISSFQDSHEEFYEAFRGTDTMLKADIGDIDITVSRESVELTEKSMEYIASKHLEWRDKMIAKANDEASKMPNERERLKHLMKFANEHSFIDRNAISEEYKKLQITTENPFELLVLSKAAGSSMNRYTTQPSSVFNFDKTMGILSNAKLFHVPFSKLHATSEINQFVMGSLFGQGHEKGVPNVAVLFKSNELKEKLEEAGYQVLAPKDLVAAKPSDGGSSVKAPVEKNPYYGYYTLCAGGDEPIYFGRLTEQNKELLEKETVYYVPCSYRKMLSKDREVLYGKGIGKREMTIILDSLKKKADCAFIGVNLERLETVKTLPNWKPLIQYISQELTFTEKQIDEASEKYFIHELGRTKSMQVIIELLKKANAADFIYEMYPLLKDNIDYAPLDDLVYLTHRCQIERKAGILYSDVEELVFKRYPLLSLGRWEIERNKEAFLEYIEMKNAKESLQSVPETEAC